MMHRVLLLVTIASLFTLNVCQSTKTGASQAKKAGAPASPRVFQGLLKKPIVKKSTKLAEKDDSKTIISATGKPKVQTQCPLAKVFGLKTTKTVQLVKKGEFKVCHNLSQTCCAKDALNSLNSRWNKYIAAEGKMVWSYTRIGRLMIRLMKNLDSKATVCVKTDKKLKKKLLPKKSRRLQGKVRFSTTQQQHAKRVAVNIILPTGAKSAKPSKERLNCTTNANELRKATKALQMVHKDYETQIATCKKTLDDIRSKMICASCDPHNNGAITGYNKKIEVAQKDFERINAACSKPYWVIWRRQRPWIKAALKYVKRLTGKKMKKLTYHLHKLVHFNNEDCFIHKNRQDAAKKDAKLIGKENTADWRNKVEQKKKAPRMLMSLGKIEPKKNNAPHMNQHCLDAISNVSGQVFDLRDNRRISSKKYKLLKVIFNTLGNKKVRASFKKIVPKSVLPLTKKQKKALKAKLAAAKKVEAAKAAAANKAAGKKFWTKAAKKVNESLATGKNSSKKSTKGKKSQKGKKTTVAKKTKKNKPDYQRLPVKKIVWRWNPITVDILHKWAIHHTYPNKNYDRKSVHEIHLENYKNTGLKVFKVKMGAEQLNDPLTK